MSCPFPGMDPFLEMPPFWSDFSNRMLTALSNDLLAKLLPRYDVRIEEYLLLSEDDSNLHRLKPDATIVLNPGQPRLGKAQSVALAEPIAVELDYPAYDPLTQRHLKVIHRPTQRVVTVIELLSPINKAPGEAGLAAYEEKRAEFLTCQCNLVELDLLRGGERLPMIGELPPGDYFAFVGRVRRKPRCQVFGWSLQSPLPKLAIPLAPEDPDEASLDLHSVFQAAYEPAFFDRRLPYDLPLVPALPADDEAWVRERLSEHAVR